MYWLPSLPIRHREEEKLVRQETGEVRELEWQV